MKKTICAVTAALCSMWSGHSQSVTNQGHFVFMTNQLPDAVATGLMPNPIFPIAIHTVQFSPDGSMLATGNGQGLVNIWDTDSGKLITSIYAHTSWAFSIQFLRSGKAFVSGGGDDALRLFRLDEPSKPQMSWLGHGGDVHAVALTSDDRRVFSAGDDQHIFSWDLAKEKAERQWQGHTLQIPTLALSPDDSTLASGSRDDSIRLWNAKTGDLKDTLIGHSDDVMSVRFSPDGKWLASAGYDETVRLWDVRTGKAVRIYKGHNYRVYSVAFSPDGNRLASAGDSTVRVWDIATGTGVHSTWFRGAIQFATGNRDATHSKIDEQVSSVVFSPDGKMIAVGSTTGAAYLVSAENGTVQRKLTAEK